jgi:nicotinamide-nucleotide adenylyltransferase
MEYGVVLMRAQPVHRGHIDIIKQALSEHQRVLVIIGSANKSGTKRNPLTIDMREHLLRNALNDYDLSTKVEIMTLFDWSKEDAYQFAKEWGNFLYYNIVAKIGSKTFTIYYNDDAAIVKNWFDDALQERVTVKNTNRKRNVSGTQIRKAFEDDDDMYLKRMLCPSTYEVRHVLKKMLLDCKKDDFIMK